MPTLVAQAKPGGAKCSPDQCRHIVKKAHSLHPVLNDAKTVERRARLFQALGNETRIRILGLLYVQEMCVCDIVAALGAAASTIAHHLRMLEDAGLISTRQDGKFTIYSVNLEAVTRHRLFE